MFDKNAFRRRLLYRVENVPKSILVGVFVPGPIGGRKTLTQSIGLVVLLKADGNTCVLRCFWDEFSVSDERVEEV